MPATTAKKLTATTPRGTFTRRSPRPYVFVVVCGGRLESNVRAHYAAARVDYERQIARYQSVVDAGEVPPAERPGGSQAWLNRTVADYQDFLDTVKRALAAVSPEAEEAEVAAEAARPAMAYGWSQAAHNAAKMADEARKTQRDVEVFPVDGAL